MPKLRKLSEEGEMNVVQTMKYDKCFYLDIRMNECYTVLAVTANQHKIEQ